MLQKNGLSLIELLVVLTIVAVLAMVALPNYQIFVVESKQAQVTQQMLKLSGQLEKWRSRSLTYANFKPKEPNDFEVAGYHIQLTTVVAGTALDLATANIATNWVMIATPMATDKTSTVALATLAMTSNGVQCSSLSPLSAEQVWATKGCGVAGQSWN